jgi:16S rRNA (cytidine1402-2'-O)-methyltransferase
LTEIDRQFPEARLFVLRRQVNLARKRRYNREAHERKRTMTGTLYLVATPIGNLEDITLRALRVLKEVDLIACEDTRRTKKLLAHYSISKPTVSYHEHNERTRATELADKLEAGARVALVTDAGTPLVSDPGHRLVEEAIKRGIPVAPVPGPSALIAALAASGLPTSEFLFAGFLPSKQTQRRARLSEFVGARATLIFYEAPHRIKATLEDALAAMGDRQSVIARELTKIHEEFLRGSLSELIEDIADRVIRGEIVLLISPQDEDTGSASSQRVEHSSIAEEVERLIAEGLDRKSALKRAARLRGITKSKAYRLLLEEAGSEETDGE